MTFTLTLFRVVDKIVVWILFISVLFSCKNSIPESVHSETKVFSLSKENDSLYHLKIKSNNTNDAWKLPYPVYRFQEGDVDGNHTIDALIGVIKPTRFDSTVSKRLFIFKNYQNLVRPLWLGSRLGRPLVDFNLTETPTGIRIRSVEREQNGTYLVAEYKWRTFGLEFVAYIRREIDSIQATELLLKH